jgi:ribose transport system substrate-binding protein
MKSTTLLLSLAVTLASLSGSAVGADEAYTIGVSNTLIGNGWREEMICSIKAQARASGKVSKVVLANRNGGPTEQIADIRSLISAGSDATIINPSDRTALDPVIRQAAARGIVVVAVDQAVTAPEAYLVSNDQVAYGRKSAEWLAEQLGGKGHVVEMRGIDGVPADLDRHTGFMEVMARYPDITVTTVFNGWALNTTAQKTKDLIASGEKIDGIFTTGQDAVVVDAYRSANVPYPLIVGADNNAFIGQLIECKDDGLIGAAVTNPASIGGAGLAVALAVLDGDAVPRENYIIPEVWDNTTDEGVEVLKTHYDEDLDPHYSVATELKPYTTYSREDILACQGPGE